VISKADPRFWRLYHSLPNQIKFAAKNAFQVSNQSGPSLNFKPLRGDRDFYSVRVGLKYRAVGERKGGTIRWFWIGSHSDFDKQFS